jgi:NADH:ubiquinone oxidoreductase subunit C
VTAVALADAVTAAVAGADVTEESGLLTVDVPAAGWIGALTAARDAGAAFFDWLSAVDEVPGCSIVCHVYDPDARARLLIRTRVDDGASLPTAVAVYPGANWHERETHEMFGIVFDGHPGLTPLLLPEEFEGHPLRKEFQLTARASKPWPGAKEPGESEHAAPSRRKTTPPGVPDPSWGPRPFGSPVAGAEPIAGVEPTAAGEA